MNTVIKSEILTNFQTEYKCVLLWFLGFN